MKTKKRQKLCYNCEGDVDLDVIVCPFCAADLREEKPEQLSPHYQQTAVLKNLTTQQSLYPSKNSAPLPELEGLEKEEPVEKNASFEKTDWLFTLLTLAGFQLFFLGVFTLIFSNGGSVTLKWSAKLWYLFLLLSLPMIGFGIRQIFFRASEKDLEDRISNRE